MIYALIIFAGSIAGRLYALIDKKTGRFFALRKGEIKRVEAHFIELNSAQNIKKVIWFHASSAGELEQAKPIIEKIKQNCKQYYIVASFFSSSGYDAGLKASGIDFCFNFPIDYKKNINRLLQCIKPDLIIYSKYDVWKNLTKEAFKRDIKLFLLSATLPKKSYRHKWPFRYFFRKIYCKIDRIYTISEFDDNRFKRMLGSSSNLKLTGDTRFDRIKSVIDNKSSEIKKIIEKEKGTNYLIAGSTYKKSEIKLIKAVSELINNGESIRLTIVPHEIDIENITRLKNLVLSEGFKPLLYSDSSLPLKIRVDEILIVDVFGVLAHLYRESDMVFVGGSYKGSIHSVLEPAIFGNPILTGPCIANSYEAIALKKIDALKICADKNSLAREIKRLIHDTEYRNNISFKVKDYFDKNTGSAENILLDLNNYL